MDSRTCTVEWLGARQHRRSPEVASIRQRGDSFIQIKIVRSRCVKLRYYRASLQLTHSIWSKGRYPVAAMIGNAFPPKFAEHHARALYRHLEKP